MSEISNPETKRDSRWSRFTEGISRNLIIILISTFLMRASFYLSISIFQDASRYIIGMPEDDIRRTIIFIAYPLAELIGENKNACGDIQKLY